jgi:hypothetical protein
VVFGAMVGYSTPCCGPSSPCKQYSSPPPPPARPLLSQTLHTEYKAWKIHPSLDLDYVFVVLGGMCTC